MSWRFQETKRNLPKLFISPLFSTKSNTLQSVYMLNNFPVSPRALLTHTFTCTRSRFRYRFKNIIFFYWSIVNGTFKCIAKWYGSLWLPKWFSDKEFTCQCRRRLRYGFNLWVRKIPWRRKWQPTPNILAWEIPWTEEPGRLQSMRVQSRTQLGD